MLYEVITDLDVRVGIENVFQGLSDYCGIIDNQNSNLLHALASFVPILSFLPGFGHHATHQARDIQNQCYGAVALSYNFV